MQLFRILWRPRDAKVCENVKVYTETAGFQGLPNKQTCKTRQDFFFSVGCLLVCCFLVVVVVVVVGVSSFTFPIAKTATSFRSRLKKLSIDWAGFRALKEILRKNQRTYYVAGGFNQSEKYARQIGSFPICRGKNKKYLKPPASYVTRTCWLLVGVKPLSIMTMWTTCW